MVGYLTKIIENLVVGNKENAISYAEWMVKHAIANDKLSAAGTCRADAAIAKNILHLLKEESEGEGEVAMCDKLKEVKDERE